MVKAVNYNNLVKVGFVYIVWKNIHIVMQLILPERRV